MHFWKAGYLTMTKSEVTTILGMLSCYYTDRRNIDPGMMVENWHLILSGYDFKEVKRAVVDFVKNDNREYPTYPVPAQIINGLETISVRDRRTVNGVILGLMYEKDFEGLLTEEKRYIRKEDYNRILQTWRYIDMVDKRDELMDLVKKLHEEANE